MSFDLFIIYLVQEVQQTSAQNMSDYAQGSGSLHGCHRDSRVRTQNKLFLYLTDFTVYKYFRPNKNSMK